MIKNQDLHKLFERIKEQIEESVTSNPKLIYKNDVIDIITNIQYDVVDYHWQGSGCIIPGLEDEKEVIEE